MCNNIYNTVIYVKFNFEKCLKNIAKASHLDSFKIYYCRHFKICNKHIAEIIFCAIEIAIYFEQLGISSNVLFESERH